MDAKEDHPDIAKHFAGFGTKVFVSTRCCHSEVRFGSNDVVLCRGDDASSVCLVKAKVFSRIETPTMGAAHLLLGCPFEHRSNDLWALKDETVEIPFAKLVRPLIWSQASEGIRVIMPRW